MAGFLALLFWECLYVAEGKSFKLHVYKIHDAGIMGESDELYWYQQGVAEVHEVNISVFVSIRFGSFPTLDPLMANLSSAQEFWPI